MVDLNMTSFRQWTNIDIFAGLPNKAHCRNRQQHEEHQIVRMGKRLHAKAQLRSQ